MSNVEELLASLRETPDHPENVAALERELALDEAWDAYAEHVPAAARALSDEVQRARFLIRSAHVCRHFGGKADLADELLKEAVNVGLRPEDDPANEEAGLSSEDLVTAVQLAFAPNTDWNGMVAACIDLNDVVRTNLHRSRLMFAMGRTYEDKLYDPERAIHCYQKAFKLNPRETEPLHSARQIYAHADQWKTVAKLYAIELKVVKEPKERGRLLKELGHVHMERLGERDAAIDAFQEALEMDPVYSHLRDVIENLRSGSGAHGVVIDPSLTEGSEPPTTVTTVEDAVELRPVTEEVSRVRPADDDGELEEDSSVAEDASTDDSSTEDAAVLGDDERDRAAEFDEQVAVADEDESAAADAEEPAVEEPAAEEPAADEPEAEDAASEELEADEPEAEDAASEEPEAEEPEAEDAASEEPEAEESAAEEPAAEEPAAEEPAAEEPAAEEPAADEPAAEDAASEEPAAEEPVAEEPAAAEPATEVPEAGEPASEEATAEEPAAAATALAAADAEPSDTSAPTPTKRAAAPARRERPRAEVAPIEAGDALPALDPSAELAEYVDGLRDASLAEGSAADVALRWAIEFGLRAETPAAEVATWVADAVSTSGDGLETIRVALPAAIGQREFWAACVDALSDADDEAAGGALFGVHFWALQDLASAEAYVPQAGGYAAQQLSVMEVAQKGNWRKTQQGLQEAVGGDETAAYRSQVTLALGLGKADKAADSLRRVLRKDKNDPDALPYHRALNRQLERWNPYADALKRMAASTDDVMLQRVLYREMVDVFRTHIEQPAAMVQALQQLSEAEPRNLEVIDELCERLEAMNNVRDLVVVLRRKAEAMESDAETLAVLEQLATLFLEKFNNQAEALRVYEEILAIDPDNGDALAQLETLYERRREWTKLIDVKRTLVERSADDARSAGLLRDAATVAATRMRDNELAESLWNDVLEFAPHDEETLTSLERLHERAKSWEKLADVLGRRVEAIEDDAERAPVLLKLGQIRADRLSDTASAVGVYEQLLEIEPDNFRAKDAVRKAYVELEDWDSLEAFYRRDNAWQEYVRQLESIAGSHKDAETQVDLFFRAATVWRDELNDEARATKSLEKVLSIDGSNESAARALVPVYEQRGDAKRLPPVLEIVLANEEAGGVRFELQAKLARLAAGRARDPEAAVRWFKQALGEQAHQVGICDEFEASAEAASAWPEVEAAYVTAREELEGEAAHGAEWLDLSLRLGHLYQDKLGDDTSALASFDDVLERDEANAVALDAKDAIFTRLGDWNSLLEVLEAKTFAAENDAERIGLFERSSLIHEEHRGDVDAAIDGYREILSIDPAHDLALHSLHRLYRQNGDANALVDVLTTLIELRGGADEAAERRSLQLELSRVAIEELSEFHVAVETLQTVVQGDPSNPEARALLEGLLGEDTQQLSVSLLLEPLYEVDGQWANLVDMLEIQLAASDEAPAQTGLLSRIGRVQSERLEDVPASMDAYARLLRIDPSHVEAREQTEALAQRSSSWTAVVELYEALLDQLSSSVDEERALAVDFGTRAAGFYDEHLEDVDEAVRMQRRVLDFEPGRLATLETLDELFTRAGRWEDLLHVCEERLMLLDDAEARRGLHFKAASIHRDMLDDSASAIDEYRKVIAAFPDDAEALEALDELYGATADSASRAEVIERRVALADEGSVAQLGLKNRLAKVYEDELGEVPRAMQLWSDVLAVDATNAAAIDGLEAQLDADDYAMAASEVLEPLYVAQSAPDALVRLLEIRLRHVHDPTDRRGLYDRIATLHENERGDGAEAFALVSRAAEEFLGDAALLDRFERLAGEQSAWAAAADRVEELADDAADPNTRRDALVRVARIRESELGDVPAAAGLWRQVLDENPTDEPGLDALERLDAQLGEWEELVEILMRKADLPTKSSDPAAYKPLLLRAATLHEEKLEQPGEAVEVLRELLSRDPSDRGALEELERLYTATERWEDLVENYEHKLRLVEDTSEKRELFFALGRVLEQEVEDPDRAVEAYRQVLAQDDADLEALVALDRLYVATENWGELQAVLESQAILVASPDEQRDIRFRMGRLQETELGNLTAAVDAYRSILEEDSAHAATRDALQSLVDRGEEAMLAATILEPIYRQEERWTELVAINATRIEFLIEPGARRDVFIDTAQVQESRLGAANAAFDAYASATREDTRESELNELERLSGELGSWEATAELFAELWDDAVDPALRTHIGLRTARVREEERGDVEGAIEAYARVNEEAPQEQSALEHLDRLYLQAGAWEALGEVLTQRVMLGGAANDAVALQLRHAELQSGPLDDPAAAVQTYREVLAAAPSHPDAMAALEALASRGEEMLDVASILDPLYRENGQWSKLVELFETRIQHEDGGEERFRLWLEAADVREQNLDQPLEAMDALGNALTERPSDVGLLERVEAIGDRVGAPGRAAEVFGRLLAQDLGDQEQLDIALRRAVVLQEKVGDDAGAEASYRTALDVEPGSVQALTALDGLTSSQERWSDNVAIVGRLREAIYEPGEQVALAFRQAETFRDKIGDAEKARETFHEVLEVDPMHRPSLDALLSLYRAGERWSELFDTYELLQSAVTDADERTEVTRQMAIVATDRLGQTMDAIDLWQAVAMAKPQDQQALEQLSVLFERADQPMDLADVLDKRIDLESDAGAQVELLHRSGALWAEALDNADMAIQRYRRVLDLVPSEPRSLHALRELYEQVGDFDALSVTLTQLLEIGEIPQAHEAAVYEQLGTIYADTLLRPDAAIEAWTAVHTRRPEDREPLERLETLYTQQEQWEPLIGVLDRIVAIADDEAEKVDLLKRIAGLWQEALGRSDKAAESYERVLDIDLSDYDAANSLIAIYEATENWDALAGLYLDRHDVVDDEWERIEMLKKSASLFEHKLGRADNAYVVMVSAVTKTPGDAELRNEVERLAVIAGEEQALFDTYRDLISQLPPDDEETKLPLLLSIGRLADEKLGSPERAEPYYDSALMIDAENEEALSALESIYTRTEDWEQLVGVVKRRANVAFDVTEQVNCYLRAGSLQEAKLANAPEAIESYKMALRIEDTEVRALDALERLYGQHGYWRELVDILERKAETTYEPEALVGLRFTMAQVWQDALEDRERAVDAYREVLEIQPNHEPSLNALEQLYADLGQWDRFLDVLEGRLLVASEPAERIRIYTAQALVHESQFDDIDEAVRCLNEVLLLEPAHLETIETLERIFSDQERIPELIDTYERHVQAVSAAPDKSAVLLKMAETQIDLLDDVPRAIDTYRRVLEVDPAHFEALGRLGALYESEEQWPEACDTYERLASMAASAQEQAPLIFRAGRLRQLHLGDLEAAEAQFNQALALDEGYLPALEALESLYGEQGRWSDAIDAIQRQIDFREDIAARAGCNVRMATIHLERLGDKERAKQLFQDAIGIDRGNVSAASALAEMSFEDQDWVRCKPLLELLLRDTTHAYTAEERTQQWSRYGVTNEFLGFHEEATRAFEEALKLTPSELRAQLGLARGYARRGDREEAFRVTMDILANHRDSMEPAAAVDCYHQAGQLKHELGDATAARSMFENALDLDPAHAPSLRALLAIVEAAGDAQGIVETKRRLLRVVTDDLERFKLLVDIGDGFKALSQMADAEAAYVEAVAIDPNSKVVLQRLLEIFSSTGNFRRATEVLGQLARMEDSPERKGRYLHAIGTIFRDELGEASKAVEFFNLALDAKFDVADYKPFQDIDHLLTQTRDWRELDRNYRKMFERVVTQGGPEHEPLKVKLLENLGEIYRSRTHELDKAVAAYDSASQLAPENAQLLQKLIETAGRAESAPQQMIAYHRRLLQLEPFAIGSYRALFRAYWSLQELDKAWCMASALSLLQKATEDEEKVYKSGLKGGVEATSVVLQQAQWNQLRRPSVDPMTTAVFETIAKNLRPEFCLDLKRNWQVNKRNDRLGEEFALTKMVAYACERVGIASMPVYQKPDQSGVLNANTDPVSLIVGQDVVKGMAQREMAFRVAKAATLMRPEFYLASAYPTTDYLKVFFFAAFASVTNQVLDPANQDTIVRYAHEIGDMPVPERTRLHNAIQTMTQQGVNPDLSAWLRDVDHTANRVGLLLCGDLRAAVASVKSEKLWIGKASVKEKVKELILFNISDEYFELRKRMGFDLDRRKQ